MQAHHVTMLGTGLIGDFYTATLHGQRGRDHVRVVFSKSEERGAAFAERWSIPEHTTDLQGGRRAPRHRHRRDRPAELPPRGGRRAGGRGRQGGPLHEAARPDGRGGAADARGRREGRASSAATSRTSATRPKTLKAIESVEGGAIGDVTWVRSRETHPGPHSAWFWDGRLTGGGAIIDLGCHCIEIIRNFVGKGNRPVEVMCTTDTLVHPIDDEDNAIALIRFESGAIGQFEVSWTFRGGMDLRDEVAGHPRHDLAEPLPADGLRDVHRRRRRRLRGREGRDRRRLAVPGRRREARARLPDMFSDMFDAMEAGRAPRETFYDGYVVNAVMDAAYRSAKSRAWEPVELFEWRGGSTRADRQDARDLRGPDGDQARAAARRPDEAHPQGSGHR